MSAQHTAGPGVFNAENHDVQHDESSMVIARVSAPDDFPCRDEEQDKAFAAECEANGRLIAVAPDLFDCVRALIKPFTDIGDDFMREIAESSPGNLTIVTARGITAHFAASILAGRAAIAKAEGRS